ncbi:MAG: 1-deoxy-D-xylulose-5-phosphate reductoisomerase, partial [Pseudomonadota bacterium]
SNVTKLANAAKASRAQLAVVADETKYQALKDELSGSGIDCAAGPHAVIEAAARPADCVVAAIVGAAGLKPSLAAAEQGRRLALANKECLVSAGDLFVKEVEAAGTTLLPVDSEHAAIHQVIDSRHIEDVKAITITASGGPFRTWSADDLRRASPDQALKHPNWSMGAKITIDSATLMNKGLELIEAFHLFPVSARQLKVVVHPQSIIHCLVEFQDGSVVAQLANPDMRTPIAYSLAWPRRMKAPTKPLDLVELGQLTFEAPDEDRFPALRLARHVLDLGGSAPNILNASNECAVAAFLDGRIGFQDIPETVSDCLEMAEQRGMFKCANHIDEVIDIDRQARQLARDVMAR